MPPGAGSGAEGGADEQVPPGDKPPTARGSAFGFRELAFVHFEDDQSHEYIRRRANFVNQIGNYGKRFP